MNMQNKKKEEEEEAIFRLEYNIYYLMEAAILFSIKMYLPVY